MTQIVSQCLANCRNTPLGVATYRDSKDVPEEYKSLRPLLEGAQRLLEEEMENAHDS